MATVSEIFVATLYFECKRAGWSEKYNLKASTYPDADIALAALAQYRRAFMGFGVEIIWARVSNPGQPREGSKLVGLPIGFLESMKNAANESNELYKISDPYLGITFRAESATHKFQNRLFRGVPDNLVYNAAYVGDWPVALAPGLLLTAPGDPNLVGNPRYRSSFLRWLITNTMMAKRLPNVLVGGVSTQQWLTTDITEMKEGTVQRHKTGKSFLTTRGRNYSLPSAVF